MQVLYGVNQRLRVEDVDSPLCAVRPVKTVLMVVITGDRGLCGGYNNFVLKQVRNTCRGMPTSLAVLLGQGGRETGRHARHLEPLLWFEPFAQLVAGAKQGAYPQ